MSRFDFLKDKYAKVGFWGTLVAAICCFTPLLVWTFAAIGLAAYVAYLDYVLLPMLALCIGLLIYGYKRYKKKSQVKQKNND
ncbi:MAG: mercury resistance system transport protein MerF [Balneolaceae bacterium]|nr:mercury resistance system transport protein MerF [Balneolaceae bacterium]